MRTQTIGRESKNKSHVNYTVEVWVRNDLLAYFDIFLYLIYFIFYHLARLRTSGYQYIRVIQAGRFMFNWEVRG